MRISDWSSDVCSSDLASQRSTDRAGWIKALVRRHLALKSRVDDGLLAELAPIRVPLLRIGRNLNQAMKAANAAMLDTGDKRIEPGLRRIAKLLKTRRATWRETVRKYGSISVVDGVTKKKTQYYKDSKR